MNLNDLNEAPMSLLKTMGQKVLSKVPGSIGAKAQGSLDAGRVANDWKKQYMTFLGQTGESPTTDNLKVFLKKLGLSDKLIQRNIPQASVAESKIMEEYALLELALTKKYIDDFFMKIAQQSFGKSDPQQRVEPTMGTPTPRSMPDLRKPASSPGPLPPQNYGKPVSSKTKLQPGTVKSKTSVGDYIRSWASDLDAAQSPQEKMNLAREMIKFLSDRQGSPEAKQGAVAAKSILKRQGMGNVAKGLSKFQMERRRYIIANAILEAVNISWKDLGYRIVLSESTTTHITIACR